MPMHSSSQIIRDVVVALAVGTAIGTTAGLWTTPDTPRPLSAVETQPAAARPAPEAAPAVAGTAGVQSKLRVREKPAPIGAAAVARPPQRQPPAVETVVQGQRSLPGAGLVPPSAESRPADAADSDLNRARELAQRADVKALLAVRERVVRRVQDAGEQDAPAARQQLEQIDRYLADARALRLRLDAQDFRKGSDRQ